MKFSKKITCKSCQLVGEGICTVKRDKSLFRADKPLEPCFKPITNRDLRAFKIEIQAADLAIYRANQPTQ